MLKISLDLNLDFSYKSSRFSKALPRNSLEFILCKRDGTIVFNLSLVLLLIEVNSILEEKDRKRYILGVCNISRIKMVLALSIKIVAPHVIVTIVPISILCLESPILEGRIYFTMFLAFKKIF